MLHLQTSLATQLFKTKPHKYTALKSVKIGDPKKCLAADIIYSHSTTQESSMVFDLSELQYFRYRHI